MKTRRSSQLASLAIAAAVSVGLAGCGGSSDNNEVGGTPPATSSGPTTHDPITVPAAAGLRVNADGTGTSNIKAGESRKAPGGGMLACATADCVLAVVRDAGDGSFTVTSTGGTVTYTPEADPEVSDAGAMALAGQLIGSAGDMPNTYDDGDADTDADAERTAFLESAGFPTDDEQLSNPKDFSSGDAPVALQGWKGERWTKDGETIVRYTDQNVKTMTDGTFASRFGDEDGGSGAEFASDANADDDEAVQWNWEHAEADALPAKGRVARFAHEGSFKGSYGGVDGEFSIECDDGESACGISRDKDGEVELLNAAGAADTNDSIVVTFKAANENAAVGYKVQDGDYLAFGWWRDASTGGTTIEDFKVLYSGNDVRDIAAALTGKATYNGHAAGNYVKGTEGGEFVADAKVEIDFDGTEPGSLDGSISNFRDASGESLGAWEVIAKDEDIVDDTNAIAYTGGADGKNWDSGSTASGILYYGNSDSATTQLPTGVAGWFRAATSTTSSWDDDEDVAVAGAFGATRHARAGQ